MFWDVFEQVMEVEINDELGRERCRRSEKSEQVRNYRNSYTKYSAMLIKNLLFTIILMQMSLPGQIFIIP